jgi:Family of unknown function (DUF6941)
MSVGKEARACIILADYANADTGNKLNLLGGGWQVTRLTQTGLTGPQALVALIEVPPQYAGTEFAMSLTLQDEADEQVKVPTPTGSVEALRIAQIVKAEVPNVPGALLHGKVWSRVQVILNFANGLPLRAGESYTWKLEIEGTHNEQWRASFMVAAVPQPVMG